MEKSSPLAPEALEKGLPLNKDTDPEQRAGRNA